jgi:hypothetical protein
VLVGGKVLETCDVVFNNAISLDAVTPIGSVEADRSDDIIIITKPISAHSPATPSNHDDVSSNHNNELSVNGDVPDADAAQVEQRAQSATCVRKPRAYPPPKKPPT